MRTQQQRIKDGVFAYKMGITKERERRNKEAGDQPGIWTVSTLHHLSILYTNSNYCSPRKVSRQRWHGMNLPRGPEKQYSSGSTGGNQPLMGRTMTEGNTNVECGWKSRNNDISLLLLGICYYARIKTMGIRMWSGLKKAAVDKDPAWLPLMQTLREICYLAL